MITDFVMAVCNRFIKIAEFQERKGMEKYGHEVQPLDPKNYDWLNMAEEELIDAFKYFYAERVKRDIILQEVAGMIRTGQDPEVIISKLRCISKDIK